MRTRKHLLKKTGTGLALTNQISNTSPNAAVVANANKQKLYARFNTGGAADECVHEHCHAIVFAFHSEDTAHIFMQTLSDARVEKLAEV